MNFKFGLNWKSFLKKKTKKQLFVTDPEAFRLGLFTLKAPKVAIQRVRICIKLSMTFWLSTIAKPCDYGFYGQSLTSVTKWVPKRLLASVAASEDVRFLVPMRTVLDFSNLPKKTSKEGVTLPSQHWTTKYKILDMVRVFSGIQLTRFEIAGTWSFFVKKIFEVQK